MYLVAGVCGQFGKKTQQNVFHVSVKQLSEVKDTMTSTVIFPRQREFHQRTETTLSDRLSFQNRLILIYVLSF